MTKADKNLRSRLLRGEFNDNRALHKPDPNLTSLLSIFSNAPSVPSPTLAGFPGSSAGVSGTAAAAEGVEGGSGLPGVLAGSPVLSIYAELAVVRTCRKRATFTWSVVTRGSDGEGNGQLQSKWWCCGGQVADSCYHYNKPMQKC